MNESKKVKINKSTKSKVETLKYILDYRALHRYGPSVSTIRDHFDLKSKSPVTSRLRTLEKLGYIERVPKISHALWVTKAGKQFIKEFEDEVEQATSDARAEWQRSSIQTYGQEGG